MSDETTTPAAATTTPSDAAPTAPATEAATPAEGAHVEAPEGTTPAEEPAEDPNKPSEAKLAKWSSKLTRKEDRIKQQRAELDAREAALKDTLDLAKAFESKKLKPLIDTYAKRHGMTFEQAYNTLTHEAVNPDVPTVDEVVDQRLAAKEAEQRKNWEQRQSQAAQANVERFASASAAYIREKLPASEHKYLKPFDPEFVAQVAVDTVLASVRAGKGEIPLDKVLADMNAAEKKRVDLHLSHLSPGDAQVEGNSERENGAGQSAKHEARKRGSPQTLNNSHAAQSATAPSANEDLSDKALTAAAVQALRSIPGWH